MPRLSDTSVPKYRKHKSGQARVVLDGRTFYLGKHGTKASQEKYNQLVGEWQANGRQVPIAKDEPISVTVLCLAYLKYAKGYYIKNGKMTDEVAGVKAAMKQLRKHYANTLVDNFGPLALQAVQDQMIACDLSRRYINQNIGRIRRMFRWGVSKELVPVRVYEALKTVTDLRKGKTVARETAPVLPVPDDVVEATKKHATTTVADMIEFQRLTGCRPGELFALRPCDIDRTGEAWAYTPVSHKMEYKGRDRTIFIGPKAQAILLPYLLKEATDFCFRTQRNKPFRKERYNKLIRNACEKAFPAPDGLSEAEVKQWHKEHRWAPNRLRHNAGTDIRKEFGLEAAQVILGHASADVTQVYAERDQEKAVLVAMAR